MAANSGIILDFDWTPNLLFVVDAFLALSGAIENMSDPLREAVKIISGSIGTNFAVSGRPAWASLSETTERIKGDSGGDGGILIRSGALASAASSEGAWSIHSDYAELNDVGVEYAMYHQEGTSRMPARPWAVIQDEDQEAIVEVFDNWLGRITG